MPTFSLLHPSARPKQWFAPCTTWYLDADNPDDVEYVFVPEPKDFKDVPITIPFKHKQIVWNTGRACLVDGFNNAAKAATGKVLIGCADDFFPFPHWDTKLKQVLEGKMDDEVVVWPSTGCPNDANFIVHPICTRKYYEKRGYWFWHEYWGWWADNEFNDVAVLDGVVLDARKELPFEHRHYSIGKTAKDGLNDFNEKESALSRVLYNARKAAGFPSGKAADAQPVISLLHPTVRPGRWLEVCKLWYTTADTPENVEYVLIPEKGKVELPKPAELPFKHVVLQYNEGRPCLVDAFNQAGRVSHGDVLVVVADDFLPAPHWDTDLIRVLGDRLHTEAAVWASTKSLNDANFILHPILTRMYFNRYGRIFWPEYIAWCADTEFSDVAHLDGVVIDAREVLKFNHTHGPRDPKLFDATYTKMEDEMKDPVWARHTRQGEEAMKLYYARKAAGFPR